MEMPATAKGIFHNLRESKYVISNSEITFYFSSKFYLNKFMAEYPDHRETFQKRMENLLKDSPFNVNTLADIKLYKDIEKRGFFVKLFNVKITDEELNGYALRCMTNKETLEWVITSYGKNKNIGKGQDGIQQTQK
jgi:hypothetical protein